MTNLSPSAERWPSTPPRGLMSPSCRPAAADALGARRLTFLDELDGELDRAEPSKVIAKLVAALRQDRPDVVVTFGPDGAYGHPDHIAISRHTTAAMLLAADPAYRIPQSDPPHRVAKLYYRVWTEVE